MPCGPIPLKKLRTILVVCLAGLLACAAAVLFCPSRSPRYEGKSVQAWFREFCTTHPNLPTGRLGPHQPSVRALRALGTNAVPYLLEQCFSQATDSAFETNVLARLSEALHPLGGCCFLPAPFVQWSAGEALRDIKPPAQLLLPPITNVLAGTNRFQRQKAFFLLGAIGAGAAEATPWLAQGLRSPDLHEEVMAMESIGRLGPAVSGVLPDLLTLLTNKPAGPSPLWWVCLDLGNLGSNALPAVPILKARLQTETNIATSSRLLTALCRIDAQAEELNTLLAKMQQETNETALQEDVNLLRQIGPNAKPAVPILLKLLQEGRQKLRYSATHTLKVIGASHDEVMPLLTQRMQDENPSTRHSFALLALLFDPGNPAAVGILLKTIQTEPNRRDAAMGELYQLGPEAKAAIPLLREAAASPDKTVSEIARRTLTHIERPRPVN